MNGANKTEVYFPEVSKVCSKVAATGLATRSCLGIAEQESEHQNIKSCIYFAENCCSFMSFLWEIHLIKYTQITHDGTEQQGRNFVLMLSLFFLKRLGKIWESVSLR